MLSGLVARGLGSVAQVGGGVGGGGPGVLGDVAGLFGEGGIGAGVLVGDPGEQVGLVAEQLGSVGGVAAEGR